MCGDRVADDAELAFRIIRFEGRVGVAEGGRETHGLSFDVAVVACGIADCGYIDVVTFLDGGVPGSDILSNGSLPTFACRALVFFSRVSEGTCGCRPRR